MSDTQEFAYYNNNGEDEASSRSDIREVEEAFEKAKTRLYFKTQGDIDETLAVVGPQEHLGETERVCVCLNATIPIIFAFTYMWIKRGLHFLMAGF